MFSSKIPLQLSALFLIATLVNCVNSQESNSSACSDEISLKGKLTATKSLSNAPANDGYLNNVAAKGGWCVPKISNQWIEADLRALMVVTAVATQAAVGELGRVVKYSLEFSIDHTDWWDYMVDGELKVFSDNRENRSEVFKHVLPVKVHATFVRFKPIETRDNYHCLRIGVFGCQVGKLPLGMEDRRIPNASIWSNKPTFPGTEPEKARLNNQGAWCSLKVDPLASLFVDLGAEYYIDGITTQGIDSYYKDVDSLCNSTDPNLHSKTDEKNVTTCFIRKTVFQGAWVTGFNVDYSLDKIQWKRIGLDGRKNKTFKANKMHNDTVTRNIFPRVKARFVSIIHISAQNAQCLRLEILGYKACTLPLGIATGRIPNSRITASSAPGLNYRPRFARMNNPTRTWCAGSKDNAPYLQIDLWITHKVVAIKTQGGDGKYVTEYKIRYTTDGEEWFTYQENGVDKLFPGNSDANGEKHNTLSPALYGVFVRVYPTKSTGGVCMRLELFGCPVVAEPLGLNSGEVGVRHIKADSWNGVPYPPQNVPLYHAFGWETIIFKSKHFLQVDFFSTGAIVTGIATKSSKNMFHVAKYILEYSEQSINWKTYMEDGQPKVFVGNKRVRDTSDGTFGIIRHNFRYNITTRYLRIVVKESDGEKVGLRMELYGRRLCDSPLGMESGFIKNSALYTATIIPGHEPKYGRLNNAGAFCGSTNTYLGIHLNHFYKITGVSIQGFRNDTSNSYVEEFSVSYHAKWDQWMWLYDGHQIKAFSTGLISGDQTKYIEFFLDFIAINLLFTVKKFVKAPCMRLEVYGCLADSPECSGPVGLANHLIPAKGITASSSLGDQYLPTYARLNTNIGNGAWCAGTQNDNQLLQIDLEWVYEITAVEIQGKHLMSKDSLNYAAVSTFKIDYSEHGVSYTSVTESSGVVKVFSGNSLSAKKVKHALPKPFKGRYIRFRPGTWTNKICMRVELFGCKECFKPLGMGNTKISGHHIRGSDWSGSFSFPQHGRLGHPTSHGSGSLRDYESFMEIYFPDILRCVSAVATEGTDHGVITAYTVSHSRDGTDWADYLENGKVKMFEGPSDKFISKVNIFSHKLKLRHFRMHFWAIDVGRHLRAELYGCEAGVEEIGLKSKHKVPDSSFQATSSDTTHDFYPHYARLNHSRAWCPAINGGDLVVDLRNYTNICRIDFRGNRVTSQYTTKVRMFFKYKEQWNIALSRHGYSDLSINRDFYSTATLSFKFPMNATQFKIHTLYYFYRGCLRLEMYKCAECKDEIVITKNFSPTYGMTASTYFDWLFKPEYGSVRIGGPNKTWCAWQNDVNQYLQWDNVLDHKVVGMTTWGSGISPYEGNGSWVTKYRVEYSVTGETWSGYKEGGQVKIFIGNSNYHIPVTHWLSNTFLARYVRLIPTEWHNWICMRMVLYGCPDRSSSLRTEQSRFGVTVGSHSHTNPTDSKLYSHLGFRLMNDISPVFLEIDLKLAGVIIYAVAMQGGYAHYELVWTYYMAYSPSGAEWIDYTENGAVRMFRGPRLRSDANKVPLKRPITTRLVRFYPTYWRNLASMAVELYGCDACNKTLGLSNGAISNGAITGSSYKSGYGYSLGRMDSNGIWCSAKTEPASCYFLQVDMGFQAVVTGFQTMGEISTGKRAKSVTVSYSDSKGFWTFAAFAIVNSDNPKLRENWLVKPFKTRILRLNVKEYHLEPCMKIEIIGCKDIHSNCSQPIGIESGLIKNESITASSSLGISFQPWFGRLNTNMLGGGWCSRINGSNQYMEVNLVEQFNIKRFMLQGVGTSWVSKYSLNYSRNGLVWKTYSEQGNEVFDGPSNGNDAIIKILSTPITVRYIRVIAKQWIQWICMRIEFGGCKVFADPLGMENSDISSANISSNVNYGSHKLRLYSLDYWRIVTFTGTQYAVIELEPFGKVITAIAMQARFHVTSLYTLAFAGTKAQWQDYIVNGKIKIFENILDNALLTRNVLPRSIYVSSLKIIPTQGYYQPEMKVELYGYDGYMDPIGIHSLPDSAFTASSFAVGNEPWRAKLSSALGQHWCPSSSDPSEYIAIDLGMVYLISAIGMEGDPVGFDYVHSFHLYSKEEDIEPWQPYTYNAQTTKEMVIFKGVNCEIPKRLIKMKHKLEARYVKIQPVAKIGKPCLRLEFYGDRGCSTHIGISSYEISNDAITASGYLNPQTAPYMARLHSTWGLGAWCAATNQNQPYLQVDLSFDHKILKVASQGRKDESAWVKSFTLSYREKDKNWQNYTEGSNHVKEFTANIDGSSVVTQVLKISRARFLRIYPKTWHTLACMRIEVYGCMVKDESVALGMQSRKIPNMDITASETNSYNAWDARLFNDYGWRAPNREYIVYLLIDLGLSKTTVSRVATQGLGRYRHSVQSYYLSFSRDGLFFYRYTESDRPKAFRGNEMNDHNIRWLTVVHRLRSVITTRYIKFDIMDNFGSPGLRIEIYGSQVTHTLPSRSNSSVSSFSYNVTSSGNQTTSNAHSTADVSTISWCTEFKDAFVFLNIKLDKNVQVVKIEIKTDNPKGFYMYYAPSGQGYRLFAENGVVKVLYNGETSIKGRIVTKQVKFKAVAWEVSLCVQIGLHVVEMNAPLLERNQPSPRNITASTFLYPYSPEKGVINQENVYQAWCAGINDTEQFLKIDLNYPHVLEAIVTKGVHNTGLEAWTSSYTVEYSLDDVEWQWYLGKEQEKVKVFDGNTNAHLTVKNSLDPAIIARYVKIHPVTWQENICLRADLYGYSEYLGTLGMNSFYIPNSAINATSFITDRGPSLSRLHRDNGYVWVAESTDLKPHIEVNLGEKVIIKGIATQGGGVYSDYFTKTYSLWYCVDNCTWTPYIENGTIKTFNGNVDRATVVTHMLNQSFVSHQVRINLTSWYRAPSLRFEILGHRVPVINGGYTKFSNWTICNATCGGGVQSRSRNCTNPVPSNGGLNCTGPAEEIVRCNVHLCPAPNVTTDKNIITTSQTVDFSITNCNQSLEKTINFGDETNSVSTTGCAFQHTFTKAGVYEVIVEIPKHHNGSVVIYAEDVLQDLRVIESPEVAVTRRIFYMNWTLSQGTTPRIEINYNDSTEISKFTIGSIKAGFWRYDTHIFTREGVHNITVVAYNLVSRLDITVGVVVEDYIDIYNASLSNLGLYDRYYQLYEVGINVTLNGGSTPHYKYHMGNGVIINNTVPYVSYKYPQHGTYNITIVVYNNASSMNVTKNIVIHPVIPINDKANATVNNTAFLTPTLFYFDLDDANPYQCIFDFGDGKSTQILSTQNLSVVSYTYANLGTYDINVTCGNALSSKTFNSKVAIQKQITGLSFVNDGPKEMNDTVSHKVTATDLGTDSCYYIDLGDGNSVGFGRTHCKSKYPHVTFKDINNASYLVQNMYYEVKVFYDLLHAWNLVSEFKIENRLPILKIYCGYPNTSIVELSSDVNAPTKISRSTSVRLEAKTTVICRATNIKDYTWNLNKITSTKLLIGAKQSLGIMESSLIPEKSLDYGLYMVNYNVSMRDQDGVWTAVEAFIEVVPEDLIVIISGGQEIERGYGTTASFDGSSSYDPDYTGTSDLGYYWLITNDTGIENLDIKTATLGQPIEQSPVFNENDFCNMSLSRRLYKGDAKISLVTSKLQLNETYEIFLVVTRTIAGVNRWKATSQLLTVVEGDPPVLGLRCLTNCLPKVILTDKYTLAGSCEEESPTPVVSYRWDLSMLEGNPSKRKRRAITSPYWRPIKNLRNLTYTELDNKNIAIKPNSLIGGRTYRLTMTAKIVGRRAARAVMTLRVNKPPVGGQCTVDIPSGFADDTNFTFTCHGWQDDDVPLSYEQNYRNNYGLMTMIYYGLRNSIMSALPIGDPEKNFTTNVVVRIFDSYRAYTEYVLPVQVTLEPGSEEARLKDLKSALGSNNSAVYDLLKDGKIQEFTQSVNAKLSVVNVLSTGKDDEESRKERQQMRTNVIKNTFSLPVDSLQAINQIGPTIAMASSMKEEVSVESQKLVLQACGNMANVLDTKMKSKAGVGTTAMMEASTTLAFCMGNLMASAGDSARSYGPPSAKDSESDPQEAKKAGKEIAKTSNEMVKKLSKSLLDYKVAGEEPTVVKTSSMSFVLARDSPSQMGNKSLGDGNAKVGLPNADDMFGDKVKNDSIVDAQFLRFKDNPMTWDESAADITSSMVSLQIKTGNDSEIKIFGVPKPFDLYIPRIKPQPEPASNSTFLKKRVGSKAYHRYNWTLKELPLFIILKPNSSKAVFEVYIKESERPNIKKDPIYMTIPDMSKCETDSSGAQKCDVDVYTIPINESIVKNSGVYYIGLKLKSFEEDGETPSRKRRDCGKGTREKRSCLQYKDPPERPITPPPGFSGGSLVDSVPTFNPDIDLAYGLQTISSPCKFWDSKREIWTSEGCKTGNFTRLDVVHCQCNHLTEFGGGLLVAPNPIDFDQVWAGFGNISDNLSVLLTICTAFGLYVLIGIWVRKKDKQDLLKGGVTLIEAENSRYLGANSSEYLITVQTGSWKNSATTAKVFLNIIGLKGQSGTVSLQDDSKQLFARGATNEFKLKLPRSLGPLQYLRVWHDMSGEDSSWYLSYVIIRDLSSNEQWIYVCDRWLALDKDDGLVDRLIIVSGEEELKNFKTLFRTKTSQDLFDGHLWLSIVGKPPKSTFTRLQRLSCCMSLLFTTMMTSAMFYNIPGGEAPKDDSIVIGPLRFSIRQLMIGIQSSFIALPVNVIIIQIFRNARPKPNEEEKKKEKVEFIDIFGSDSEEEETEPKDTTNKKQGLPYWTIYIAWTLCFLMTLVSATITLFYSMMWGKEISEQWLTSMLVSFFQDAFVTQPIKVCGIALFVAAVLKTLPNDFKNASKRPKGDDGESQGNQQFNIEDAVGFEPPDPEVIEKARQYKLKENQMFGIMKENIFHAVFLLMLVVISYSDRDPMAYFQKKTIQDRLNSQITDAKAFWSYLDGTLLPFAYDGRTSKSDPDLEGFTVDGNLYIVGMPRLRQLRVQKGPCPVNFTEHICENFYSAFDEDQSFYLPGWRKEANLTSDACPEPWKYRGMLELNGMPYWGQANMYGGGGYTANLGYNTDQANRIIRDLKANKWIDDQTRAIFIEFTVYNAYSNLFSVMTLLVEMQGLGGAISLLRIETFRLYPNPGPNDSVVMFCQFLVVLITIISTYTNVKKIYHLRKEYFKNTWNIVQLVIIILTYICVGLVIIRKLDAKRTIQKVYDNPFLFISFYYTMQWSAMNTYFIALIVFFTTLRFLYLLSFNHHIIVLYKTLIKAKPSLALLGIEAFILFASLVSAFYLIFGRTTDGFGSVFLTVQTLLAMVLGKAYFVELSNTDTYLGPIFFVVFAIFMVFFLLNMFMAVLMDSYEEAKEEANPSNEEFEIADFMMQRLKVMIGVGQPSLQPWNAPRLEYIHGVDEETQKRLDFEKRIEELPKKVVDICETLHDLENMNIDIAEEGEEVANTLVSLHEDGELRFGEDDTWDIVEYLQDEQC